MMFGIWILWLGLVVLIFWGVRVFVDNTEINGKRSNLNRSAMDILRERFAKGEIDETEFEKRKNVISSQ